MTWDTDEADNQSIRDMKEQEVYFSEIPLMTDHGTFIINGDAPDPRPCKQLESLTRASAPENSPSRAPSNS